MNEKATNHMINRLSNKLKEYMSEKEHLDFSAQIAKEAIAIEIDQEKEKKWREYCLKHFDEFFGERADMRGDK